ncbi:MAG: GIY-YIG nuclease family protein [Bacteroidales bacterium]
MIIYKITNLINQKIYIGQTIQPMQKRWQAHCHKNSRCLHLAGAIKQYGKESFKIEQIDTADTLDSLNDKEEFWIAFFDCMNPKIGYNLMSGGKSRRWSDESKLKAHNTRQKVGYSRTGSTMSEANKQALKKANTGLKRSEDWIEKFTKRMTGRKASEETKAKMKLAHKGRTHSEETKDKMKELAAGKRPTESVVAASKASWGYIYSRGWKCKQKEAKQRLIREVIVLLEQIQGK